MQIRVPGVPDDKKTALKVLRWLRQREQWGPAIAGSVKVPEGSHTVSQLIEGNFVACAAANVGEGPYLCLTARGHAVLKLVDKEE